MKVPTQSSLAIDNIKGVFFKGFSRYTQILILNHSKDTVLIWTNQDGVFWTI